VTIVVTREKQKQSRPTILNSSDVDTYYGVYLTLNLELVFEP